MKLKYILAGGVSYLVYLLISICLIELFHFASTPSAIISYGIAILFNFFLNASLVFKRTNTLYRSGVIYIVVGIGGYVGNILGFYLLVEILSVHYLISQTALFFFIGITTFLINRSWTFSDKLTKNKL